MDLLPPRSKLLTLLGVQKLALSFSSALKKVQWGIRSPFPLLARAASPPPRLMLVALSVQKRSSLQSGEGIEWIEGEQVCSKCAMRDPLHSEDANIECEKKPRRVTTRR